MHHRPATRPLTLLAASVALLATGGPHPAAADPYSAFAVIAVAESVRDSMNVVFLHSTLDWRRYASANNPVNFGMGSPIWREAMRCLHGRVSTDTLWITGWSTPQRVRAFASAVTGDCSDVADLVGTWHTHPWRADSLAQPVKTRGLSPGDLRSFRDGADRIALVQWDRDSVTAAARSFNGSLRYPVELVFGPDQAP